jgi:hypothetical protein
MKRRRKAKTPFGDAAEKAMISLSSAYLALKASELAFVNLCADIDALLRALIAKPKRRQKGSTR